MNYEQMGKEIDNFVDEYYRQGDYEYLRGPDYNKKRTKEELNEYRKRLKTFFENNDVPEEFNDRFDASGVGSSFYMAYGYGILENLD